MREMSGADAWFLREESRAQHMHTLKVAVIDPGPAHEPPSIARVRAGAVQFLPREPAFRRRPLEVPAFFGNPFWTDADEIDPDYHVRHEVLPAGSGSEALDELLGRIASEPLDRTRPLWQIVFVEGLPGGRVAYVTKLHHAIADGAASAELVLRSFQAGPERVEYPDPRITTSRTAPPSRRELILAAAHTHARRQRELPGLILRSLRDLRTSRAWCRSQGFSPVRPFRSPPTRFNQAITPNRVFAHVNLPLSEIIAVKRSSGCTVNDVYLALVGGALRSYLEECGESPVVDLSAAVPVSVRTAADDPAFGNALAYWFVTTASGEPDPLRRLALVAESTRAARSLFERRDRRLTVEWFDHWVLRHCYLIGLQRFAGSLMHRPSVNVIVSNVKGPDRPLYSNGAPVVELFSMGPLSLQQGLNFTAWSYLDTFAVGVHGCREHVPDVARLANGLAAELELLRKESGLR